MREYILERAGGLHAFNMNDDWYVFLPALASVVNKTTGNISVLLNRHPELTEGALPRLPATPAAFPLDAWTQLVKTYQAVTLQMGPGPRKKRKRSPLNLALYPIELAVRIVRHYNDDVDTLAAEAVEAFWGKVRPEQGEDPEDSKHSDPEEDEIRDEGSESGLVNDAVVRAPSSTVKREPASFLEFSTIMRGPRMVIDLTGVGNDDGEGGDNVDALQAQLADNFLAPRPPAGVDAPLKREYRLKDEHISDTLKEQCIRFGDWRSALWSWSRDAAPVSATTVDGNVSHLLLFAGSATSHAPIAYRITPELAFDLSVVFGSHAVIEPLVIGYLRWLRRERRVMYSTCLGYLNALVVMANYYFADPSNSSFDAGRNEQAVKSGLRRLRSHAHSAAQKEGKQKPVHPHWISWRTCQYARRRAAHAYLRVKEGPEGKELQALYAELERNRQRGTAQESDAMKILHHPVYVRLQQLVCVYLHSIAAPVRVSITRCLEFRTTFVKMRTDPSRYVIDLKNNPESASARHKTSSHYRRAILPQPAIERMNDENVCQNDINVVPTMNMSI
jgi:hypothetical protein